jgi:predicted chitinase
VVRPHELADQKWAALGPAYWWAIKYPRINEYADRGDIDNVSKWVNAPAWVDSPSKHANGEKARRDAYNQALALGDQLLTLTNAPAPQGDDDLSAEAEQILQGST